MPSCKKILDLRHLKLANLKVSREQLVHYDKSKTKPCQDRRAPQISLSPGPRSLAPLGKVPAMFHIPQLLAWSHRKTPHNVHIVTTATIHMT